jgi:capsular polysaccharide biosynthesis protein
VTSTRETVSAETYREDSHADGSPSVTHPSRPRPRRADSGLTLREVLQLTGRNWFIVVAAVVAALAGGAIITAVSPQSYETKAAVLVIPAGSGDANSMAQAASFVSNQVATYAALAETPAVLDPAIEKSGVRIASTDLVDDVTSELVPNTSIINLTVDAGSAREAAELANAIAASLIDKIEAQTPVDSPVRVTGSVVESPEIPDTPSSPNLILNLLLALAVGLLVAFLAIIFRQALTVGTDEQS